jgi:hypothetical protein
VRIDSPTWYATAPCPDCGQGSLAFVTCTICGALSLECEETDSVFSVAVEGESLRLWARPTKTCAGCEQPTSDFLRATNEMLEEAGIPRASYR